MNFNFNVKTRHLVYLTHGILTSIFQDPAGVQALLDQIKSSSAWQELSAASTVPPEQASLPGEAPTTKQHSTESPPGHSVAALLSQLQSPQEAWKSPANEATDPTSHSTSLEPVQSQPPYTELTGSHSAISEKDVHSLDFDESLPILLRLSRDPSFVNEMQKVLQFPNISKDSLTSLPYFLPLIEPR